MTLPIPVRWRHPSALIGSLIVLSMVLVAVLAPWITSHDPEQMDMANRLAGPSGAHWLGTDNFGRDLWTRMALGARPRDIAWPVLRSALRLAVCGLLVGIPLALALTRVLRSVLYGVTPYDPVTLAASALLILAVATVAAWIPARRAAKIDPMEALRYE